jgi:prolyl oligopeptidase
MPDGHYLVIGLGEGGRSRNSRFVYRDLRDRGGQFVDLIAPPDAIHRLIGNDGPVFYFQTVLDAPRGRVIAIDTRRPGRGDWKTVIPQAGATLVVPYRIGGRFIGNYFKDAHTQIKTFSRDGAFLDEWPLPGIGTAGGIEEGPSDAEIYYVYLSSATLPTVFRRDLTTRKTALWRRPAVSFDPGDYAVKQVFYRSEGRDAGADVHRPQYGHDA